MFDRRRDATPVIVTVSASGDEVRSPAAITIGHTVTFPEGANITEGWIEHEFTHVLQYEIVGAVIFGASYGLEYSARRWILGDDDPYGELSSEQWAHDVGTNEGVRPGMNPFGEWNEMAD